MPPILLTTKRLSLLLFILLVALCIPAVWVWWTFFGPGYYAEFNDIKNAFQNMPEVEIVRAGGNEDVTFEDIWARIRIKGKGEMMIGGLTRQSFENISPHISIREIGPYKPKIEGKMHIGATEIATGKPVRSQFWGSGIDIGSEGAFARFFPFQIKNMQDAIARYDDICAVLAEWPVSPDKKHFQDENGNDYYYCVEQIK